MNDLAAQLDSVSLMSRTSVTDTQWASYFDNRIYIICGQAHPGMAIDNDAVVHVRETISQIIYQILDLKPNSVAEIEKVVHRQFPKSLHWITQDASEANSTLRRSHNSRFGFFRPHESQQKTLVALIEEILGPPAGDRRDREREKEIERMAGYLLSLSEIMAEDIIKCTGNFVKYIRSSEPKITLQNLKIAINADKGLMELTSNFNYDDDDPIANGFFSDFSEYDEEAPHGAPSTSYDSVAREFLKEEQIFLREINQAMVFRRRLEQGLHDEDKGILKQLFGNLQEIYELTLKMERILEDSIELNDSPCVGLGVWEIAEVREFDGYFTYLWRGEDEEQSFISILDDCINELATNPRYSYLYKNDDNGYANSLDGQTLRLSVRFVLPNLLQGPILHFFRYVDFILKLSRLAQTDDDISDLENCRSYFVNLGGKIENHCSSLKSKIKAEQTSRSDSLISQLGKLQNIQSKIDGFSGSPIGKTCTELIKEGPLQLIDHSRKAKNITERYIYLFDQLLLICKRHKYAIKYKDRSSIQLLEPLDSGAVNGFGHTFRLDIKDKSENCRSYTAICKTELEKMTWLTSFITVTTKSLLDRLVDAHQKEDSKKTPLIIPSPDQYRFAEADTDENITFEDYSSRSGLPEIRSATILKLIERLTYHQYSDSNFTHTFMIFYRSFCQPTELLDLLIERFSVPIPSRLVNSESRGGPLAGRYDTIQSHGLSSAPALSSFQEQCFQRFRKEYERPIQKRVITVMNHWVKSHWYDFENDPQLLEKMHKFLQTSCESSGKLTNQHKKCCKTILGHIERNKAKNALPQEGQTNTAFDWDEAAVMNQNNNEFNPKKPEPVWHAAKKGDIDNYDLLTLHPLEIGRQLTILHFDLYRAIKPIELVDAAWTKADKYKRSPQLLKLTGHCTLLTYWVSRSIVETASPEERVAMILRVIEVMSVFEELHNFTGMVAFQSALNQACVHRLISWERMGQEKAKKSFDRFDKLCETRYIEMQKRLQNINPPCVPFFGVYLSTIFRYEAGNSTFVKSPNPQPKEMRNADSGMEAANKRMLVSLFKCRRIAEQIREIQMYQNQPYDLQLEPTIRHFFETINPKAEFEDDHALDTYLYECSLKVLPKDDKQQEPVRPRHPAHVLKSPGTKPPKTNHYSVGHHGHAHTVPSTPSHESPNSPRSAHTVGASSTRGEIDGHSTMTIDNHHSSKHQVGDVAPTLRRQQHAPAPKIGTLLPPPLHPRKPKNLPPVVPSSSAPPPLFPRKTQPLSPLLSKTPPTPKSAHRQQNSPTFVFPPGEVSPVLARVQRNNNENGQNNEQLRVVLERSNSRNGESHSPTVCLSVPLPPALPPPRRRATTTPTPPPLPPKTYRGSTSPSSAATSPTVQAPSRPSSPPSGPPPLPPRTYKTRKDNNSSPTMRD